MNLLIIGSKGFIGSYFVSFFRNLNWKVFECDVAVDHGNPFYFAIDPISSNYSEVFDTCSFDVCINCSGTANVSDSISNPSRDFQLNVRNLYFILEALRKFQPNCKFINLSSAAVYGSPERLPISESANLKPLSPYGFHKKIAEDICVQFHNLWGLKICSMRIFSAFGEGLKKQLFWDIYKKSQSVSIIEMFGTGKESRDFIHISDLAHATDLIIEKADFKSEKVNIANGAEVFIDEVVRKFLRALDFQGSVIFTGQERRGDPNNWKADISILKSFGYKQSTDLNTGLKHYADWVQTIE